MRNWSFLLTVFVALVAWVTTAEADLPAPEDLLETREVVWTGEDAAALLAKANELADAASIYEFVRNELDFALYDGSRSNSANIYLNRRGNDVDLASTLIAMLRSQGIPARYATGVVSVSFAELENWIEIPNATRASSAMGFAGFQNVSNSGGRTSFNHAWVQAFVPLERYRGNDSSSPIDCIATPSACTWVNLDPSFKQRKYRDAAELVDVSDIVLFDYQAYFRAEDTSYPQPDAIDRREKNPLEVYEEMVLDYLHSTPGLAGKTLEDVIYEGDIIKEVHGVLPTSTPFRANPANVSTYSSVDDHDADGANFDWTKMVSFTVKFPKFSALASLTLSGGAPVPLSELANKNLIVAYESTDFDDAGTPKTLVARLGDQIHETILTLVNSSFTSNGGSGTISGDLPDVATPFDVTLTMEGNASNIQTAVYPDLALGGYFLVATGGEFSGFAEVRRSTRQLLENVEQNPVIDDGSGVLYVDENGDGSINPGEPTLLEDAATQRLLTGGVLAIARDLYYAQVRAKLERLTKLQRTTMPPSGFLGVVSSVHDVKDVAGTAFSVTPVGLLVDMKALSVTPPYKIDQNSTQNPRAFRLGGHILSALEHEIWQELTGFEAISTMKGIQRTGRDGGVVMELDEGQTQVTIADAMTNWGLGQSLPSGVSSVDLPLFSHNIWLPRTNSTSENKTLSVIRETVTSGNSVLEKRGWDISIFRMTNGAGNVYGNDFENLFRFVYDNYTQFQGFPSNTPFSNPPHNLAVSVLGFSISGCTNATTTGQAVNNYPGCFAALMNRPELQSYSDYLDFFDKNQGFVFGGHMYRDSDPTLHIRAQSLAPLRNEIVLGADRDKNGVPDGNSTTEVVIPNIVADGELIDFAVWIQRYFNASGIEDSAGYIINRAGGGYVSGLSPININDPFDITWSNDVFWEDSLNSSISNSIFGPSTFDPISTVTGNMYIDETDLRIRGRGEIDYVFNRTYNSNLTQSDTSGVPMGNRWTHSYNMRLIARDYGREPNSTDPHASDAIVSSITYVDERAGEHLFSNCAERLDRIQAGSPSSSGWIDVRCDLGTLGSGSHSFTIGVYNNSKTTSSEATEFYIDDVVVEGEEGDPPILEAHFDSGVESFVYVDDAFGTSQPAYAGGTYTGSGGQSGGGLRVDVGGVNGADIVDMSGGWRRTFSLASASRVILRYSYKLDPDSSYDSGEFSESMLSADAVTFSALDLAKWKAVNPRGTFDSLDLGNAGASEYVIRFRNGTEYVFGDADLTQVDAVARLKEIRDPYGNALTLGYSGSNLTSITDNLGIAGRTGLVLTYDPSDRLQTVADWDSRTWTYAYDAAGNLASAENPLGELTEYDYDADTPTLIAVRTDLDGDGSDETLTSFDYYENGRAFSNANAFGDGETVEYDLFRKRTRITDPRGFVTKHDYDENGELLKLTRPNGGIQTYESQPNGRRFRKTDYRGFETLYSYCTARTVTGCSSDTGGNVTFEIDAFGDFEEFDYDTSLFDAVVRNRRKDGSVTLSTYYQTDNPGIGAVRGRLEKVEVETLGAAANVLLADYKYNADGTLDEGTEYIVAGSTVRWRKTQNTYEPGGLSVASATVSGSDGSSVTTSYTYDALGRLETESQTRSTSLSDPTPVVLTNRYDYDDLDRVIRVTDPIGNEVETEYFPNGLPKETRIRYKKPDATFEVRVVERRTYDDANRLVTVTDVNDAVTTTEYDEAGNLVRVTGPTGTSARFEYDEVGNQVAVVNENGHRSSSRYDVDGRVVESIDPSGNATRFVYDEIGRLAERHDPLQNETRFGYDGLGRPTRVIDAEAVGNPSRQNADGASVSREYDELGRLVKVIDALDKETLYEYDLLGNRTKVTDAEGQETTFVYDDLGRLEEIIDSIIEPGSDKTASIEYDEIGNVVRETDRNGNLFEHTYDGLNRLERTDLLSSGRVFVRTYDLFGNPETLTTPELTMSYTYDNKDRLETVTDSRLGRSMTFVYDAADRLIAKTDYQGDVTEYLYDSSGRLIAERNPAYLQVSYHYDAAGRLVDRLLSNGASTQYGWDAAGRLTSLANRSASGTIVSAFDYTHDDLGNVLTANDGTNTTAYGYDFLYRLTSADLPGTTDDSVYTYDDVGNRKTVTVAGTTYHYCYDAADCSAPPVGNRLMNIRTGSPTGPLHRQFTYDDNGAAQSKLDGTGAVIYSLSHDDQGRVTTASGPGFSNGFGYEAGGLRVRRDDSAGSHLFHLEGRSVEAVYDGATGALRSKYLRGAIIDEVVNGYLYDAQGAPTNYTYHHDAITSVVGLSGHAGSVEEVSSYAPFGASLGAAPTSANPLRFTGREQDPDTGLYYYRARYFDTEIGRFLSEDPIGFEGGINFYAYVENNPINLNDPTGRCVPWCTALAGGVFGAISGAATAAITGGDITDGIIYGALGGAVIGSGVGLLGGGLVSAGLVTEFTATFGSGIATGFTSSYVGSAVPQAIEFGPDNVDYGVALNNAFAGAAVATLPALVSASAATATAVGGGALYTTGQQIAITGALSFYDVAAGSAINVGLGDYLDQPTSYTTPTDFGISFPSTSTNFDYLDSVYNCCK